MGSFIDGFQDMEIRVSMIQFDTCSFGNKGTKEYLVKNFILFVASILNKNLTCILIWKLLFWSVVSV